MRRLGVLLVVLCAAVPAAADAAPARDAQPPICTAFGKTWMSRYNSQPGPIRIVSACCGLRSVRTHDSACTVMVTVRKGRGAGTFGCSVATVAPNFDILANRPQACRRSGGVAVLAA